MISIHLTDETSYVLWDLWKKRSHHTQFSVLWAICVCVCVCVCVLPIPWESMHLHFLLFQVSEERKSIWSPFGHHSFHNKPSFPESYWVIPLFSLSRLNNSSPFNLFSEVLFASLQLNHFHYSPLGSLQVFCIKICCFAIEMPQRVLFFHLNQDKRKAAPRPTPRQSKRIYRNRFLLWSSHVRYSHAESKLVLIVTNIKEKGPRPEEFLNSANHCAWQLPKLLLSR